MEFGLHLMTITAFNGRCPGDGTPEYSASDMELLEWSLRAETYCISVRFLEAVLDQFLLRGEVCLTLVYCEMLLTYQSHVSYTTPRELCESESVRKLIRGRFGGKSRVFRAFSWELGKRPISSSPASRLLSCTMNSYFDTSDSRDSRCSTCAAPRRVHSSGGIGVDRYESLGTRLQRLRLSLKRSGQSLLAPFLRPKVPGGMIVTVSVTVVTLKE